MSKLPATPLSTTSEATALRLLAKDYWEARMANEPLYVTSLGDRRNEDRMPDITPSGRERALKQYENLLSRVTGIRVEELNSEDRVTRSAFIVDLRAQVDYGSCDLEEWTVDPLAGPQVEFFNVESYQPIRSVTEGHSMVRRWQAMGQYLNEHMANLQIGVSTETVGVRICVEKALQETEDALEKPNEEWHSWGPRQYLTPIGPRRSSGSFEKASKPRLANPSGQHFELTPNF